MAAGSEASTQLESLSLEDLLQVQLVPVDVHGTHIHQEKEWMVSYQFHFMEMRGNRDGERRLSFAEVLAEFPVTPTRMTVQTSVAEVMYGLTDRVTLMAMIPHHRKKMEHVTRSGVRFTTLSEGVGDIMLGVHLLVKKSGSHWWIVSPHLGLPTGSIDERDATPAGANQKLPYPMQLGSGSVDFIPEVNYLWQTKESLLGAHAMVRLSLDENDNGYRVGDRYHLGLFFSRKLSRRWAASARLDGKWWANYSGADPDLDPAGVPTADPHRRGGRRIETLLGINLFNPSKHANLTATKGHRFTFELGIPVHQSLDGPQLETDWTGHFAWQWTF